MKATAFKIGSASEGLIGAFCPHQIIKAMVYYGSAHPGMAVLRANFFQDPRPPETVSDLIKLGVSAEIVFFDLLLEDLSRASK